jgi:integrase
VPKLTEITLRNLPIPQTGQVTYLDEGSPLRVRVSQGGAKTFIVSLGRGRRYTIGRFGEVSLSDAREAARRLRAEKTLGRFLPASKSLADARKEYLAAVAVRGNTRIYYERNLTRLSGSRLSDVTPRDINRILDGLSSCSRDQCLASFRPFFKWCIRRHYLDKSPCELMTLGKAPKRARVLNDEEQSALWTAAEQIGGHFGTIVRLLVVTGQRRGEIAALRADFFKGDLCTLPATLTKNGRQHTFPIGSLAASLLSEYLTNPVNGALLFPARGTDDHPFNGWSKSKAALDKLSGIADWTLHDLRRTFRTIHARIGTPPHIAERIINHVSSRSQLEEIYDQYKYLPEMRQAASNFDSHVANIVRSQSGTACSEKKLSARDHRVRTDAQVVG